MLTLEVAQARLLALAPTLPNEDVAVEAALGRVLAEDLLAARTQPPADLSAMDGYAVAGDGPWRSVGESRAGAPFDRALVPGEAVRISTGAQMPPGADSVLIQENAVMKAGMVSAAALPPPGQHVRPRGFDFDKGDTLLPAGTGITPARLALALAAGHARLKVARRPRVAVLDCGDELAAVAAECKPHQIPASNGAMIAAMLHPMIGGVQRIGPVGDRLEALADALAQAEDCDILITSGGASVGDHDLVQTALGAWGAKIDFWKVAIKPGKPLMVATRGQQMILGLPGNPVSSFVTAFLIAIPLIRASMGDPDPLPRTQVVKAGEDLPGIGDRREFLRGVSDGQTVRLAPSQDLSALLSLAQANCLVDRPAGTPPLRAGEQVAVYNLQNG